MKALISAVALGIMLAMSSASFSEEAVDYHVTRSVVLGSPDRWDYVIFDPASGRVYVAHGDEITVVDGKGGAIVGHVKGLPGGTHGVAIVTSLGIGFTDDGEAGQAAAFDLASLSIKTRVKAAEDADAIALDPQSGHVFVINGDTGTITVIDPKTSAAVATIQGGGKLEYAVASGTGKLYVNGADKKEVLKVDTQSNRVEARWPIPNCTSPHGLALDPATHRLFVSCLNNLLTVLDADRGRVVTTLPIGSGSDAVVFDPKRKLIFSSNGRDGTLSIIAERDAETFVSVGSVKTALSARTMGIDPVTGRIYLAAADVDPKTTQQKRPAIVPGSLKLLFLDPTH